MKFKHLAAVFSTIGVAFIAAGFASYQKTTAFLDHAIVTAGEVVHVREIRKTSGPSYRPVIRYLDHTGELRQFEPNFSTNPPAYFKGERVEVLYDPRDPKYPLHVRINDGFGLWLQPIGLSAFGSFFLLVVIVMSYLYKRGGEVTFGKQSNRPSDGYDF